MARVRSSAGFARRAARMLLGLALTLSPLPAIAARAPLVLRDLGRATEPLDGSWQFHTGDDLAWVSTSFDDSAWQSLKAGKPWDAQGHWGYTGFAWYWRHVEFAPGTPADLSLAFYLPIIDSACEVYWHGKLIGGIGKLPPHPVWYQNVYPIPAMLGGKSASGMPLGTPQPGVLAIRVWKAPTILFAPPEEGGLIAVPQVGSAGAVAAVEEGAWYHWLLDNQFTLAVALLSSVVSLICLLFGLRNRRNLRVSELGSGNYALLFWLAVVLAYPLELFLLGASGIVLGISFRWGYGLIGIVIGIYDAALWFVLIHLLGLAGNRRLVQWTKVMVGLLWTLDALDGAL
jgi:hypothetical protein